jgi:hypothetical protein
MIKALLDALALVRKLIAGVLGDAPGSKLLSAAKNANPLGGTVNCGHIIDAVAARIRGTDPNATAPLGRDGYFADIENRFNTTIDWGSDFQSAFDAVRKGGDGTMAVVGMTDQTGWAHVVLLVNDRAIVGIVEAQDGGPGYPPEVITNVGRANTRYNLDGRSYIGWGLVPKGK